MLTVNKTLKQLWNNGCNIQYRIKITNSPLIFYKGYHKSISKNIWHITMNWHLTKKNTLEMLTNTLGLFSHIKTQNFSGRHNPLPDPTSTEERETTSAPQFRAFNAASTPSASRPHSAPPCKKFCGCPRFILHRTRGSSYRMRRRAVPYGAVSVVISSSM